MSGSAFLFVFAAGWVACLLWVHRVAVLAWLVEAVDALTTDPPPAAHVQPPRHSHVHLVHGSDGPEAA